MKNCCKLLGPQFSEKNRVKNARSRIKTSEKTEKLWSQKFTEFSWLCVKKFYTFRVLKKKSVNFWDHRFPKKNDLKVLELWEKIEKFRKKTCFDKNAKYRVFFNWNTPKTRFFHSKLQPHNQKTQKTPKFATFKSLQKSHFRNFHTKIKIDFHKKMDLTDFFLHFWGQTFAQQKLAKKAGGSNRNFASTKKRCRISALLALSNKNARFFNLKMRQPLFLYAKFQQNRPKKKFCATVGSIFAQKTTCC